MGKYKKIIIIKGNYLGIDLHYGRKTGYGSYGPAEGVLKGAKVIYV